MRPQVAPSRINRNSSLRSSEDIFRAAALRSAPFSSCFRWTRKLDAASDEKTYSRRTHPGVRKSREACAISDQAERRGKDRCFLLRKSADDLSRFPLAPCACRLLPVFITGAIPRPKKPRKETSCQKPAKQYRSSRSIQLAQLFRREMTVRQRSWMCISGVALRRRRRALHARLLSWNGTVSLGSSRHSPRVASTRFASSWHLRAEQRSPRNRDRVRSELRLRQAVLAGQVKAGWLIEYLASCFSSYCPVIRCGMAQRVSAVSFRSMASAAVVRKPRRQAFQLSCIACSDHYGIGTQPCCFPTARLSKSFRERIIYLLVALVILRFSFRHETDGRYAERWTSYVLCPPRRQFGVPAFTTRLQGVHPLTRQRGHGLAPFDPPGWRAAARG